MMAGALAGSATVLITNPIWVINTRMTARKHEVNSDSKTLPTSQSSLGVSEVKPRSTIGTIRALLRDEGCRSLFAGVLPALVLVINPILQYTIFEKLRDLVERRRKVLPRDIFLLGAIGKLLATGLTYPYITIKSRMHVAKNDGPKDNLVEALRRIVREEGWNGLYGGWSHCCGDVISFGYADYSLPGIGLKLTQSVITAAFLFAFKDALYEWSVGFRKRAAQLRIPLK